MDELQKFRAKLWLWKAGAAWHFLTLPKEMSTRIRFFAASPTHGFGSVRVEATIGKTTWKTSLFPSKESKAYILPVKADVRRSEKLLVGKFAQVTLRVMN